MKSSAEIMVHCGHYYYGNAKDKVHDKCQELLLPFSFKMKTPAGMKYSYWVVFLLPK